MECRSSEHKYLFCDGCRKKQESHLYYQLFLSIEVTAVEREDKFLPFGSLHVQRQNMIQ